MSIFTIAVIGGLTSLPGAILGAVYVEGVPFLFSGDETIRLLTSSVGLLLLLLIVPGGLSEIVYRSRDSFLRWVAARNGIHVPSPGGRLAAGRHQSKRPLTPTVDDLARRRRCSAGRAHRLPGVRRPDPGRRGEAPRPLRHRRSTTPCVLEPS